MDLFNYNINTNEETEDNEKLPVIEKFNFNIIYDTEAHKNNMLRAETEDYIRDICDPSLSNLTDDEIDKLDENKYINVVQKSDTWLNLRARSCGTASKVGIYIFNRYVKFARICDVKKAWYEKLKNDPFKKTHVVSGHMNWGVTYENTALIHLAFEENVGVTQVGSIKVTLDDILELGKYIYKEKWIDLKLCTKDKYLLVSPDGIVGRREPICKSTEQYSKLIGMLEIKCISPFYHLETDEGLLRWVIDGNFNKRQWNSPEEIPYVYVIQQALQAISGVTFYRMKKTDTMWFIRWSPLNMSVFTFKFGDLIELGTCYSNLYFSLYNRTHTAEDVEKLYPLSADEAIVEKQIEDAYLKLMKNCTYKKVSFDCYPEFMDYYNSTKNNKFYTSEEFYMPEAI